MIAELRESRRHRAPNKQIHEIRARHNYNKMPGSEEIATTRLDEAAKTAAASLDGRCRQGRGGRPTRFIERFLIHSLILRIAVGLNDELWNLVSLVIDAKENGSGVQLGTSTAAVSAALRFVRNACAGVSANQERATWVSSFARSMSPSTSKVSHNGSNPQVSGAPFEIATVHQGLVELSATFLGPRRGLGSGGREYGYRE